MVSKKDPICGMQGHIKAHGKYFCSQEHVDAYAKRQGLQPSLMSRTWFKVALYTAVVLLIIGLLYVLQTTGYMILFMGLFFIAVSLLKLADWKGFAQAFRAYDIIARRSQLYGYVYPLIELAIGIAYLLSFQIQAAAAVTFIVMAIGTAGVTQNLLRKNPVRCACFGTLVNIPLTKFTFFEDVTMAVMALMVLFL